MRIEHGNYAGAIRRGHNHFFGEICASGTACSSHLLCIFFISFDLLSHFCAISSFFWIFMMSPMLL